MDEKTPCVFVLSRGADPMALLMKFASSVGMENNLEVVSLGKGQGPRAEEAIKVSLVYYSYSSLKCQMSTCTAFTADIARRYIVGDCSTFFACPEPPCRCRRYMTFTFLLTTCTLHIRSREVVVVG